MRRLPFTLGDRSINSFSSPAGISNRVIPIGCVLHLAAELNYRPVIFWVRDEIVGKAGFGDLFETADLPFELVESVEAKVTRAVIDGYLMSANYFEIMFFRLFRPLILSRYRKGVKLPLGTNAELVKFRDRSALSLDPGRGYVVSTSGYFRYGCDLSWLAPAPQLTPRIVELKKRFAPDTVGVHIRGTDMPGTVPVEKVIARMRVEIELNPEVKFFLASDGDKNEDALVALFEDRLIRSPQSTPRKTVEGQYDAVVDLFGLAATARIIGRRRSAFTTLAALIGNKPLLRVT